jgi:hypothetical protein
MPASVNHSHGIQVHSHSHAPIITAAGMSRPPGAGPRPFDAGEARGGAGRCGEDVGNKAGAPTQPSTARGVAIRTGAEVRWGVREASR